MRPLLLYARSRHVPAAVAAAALCSLLVHVLAPSDDPRWPALAITAAVCALSTGLTGQDADLDRTAAWPWPVYRLAHVVAVAGVAVVLVAGTAPLSFVVRGCVGMTGLVALGAALFGAHVAWTLPCVMLGATFFTDSWLYAPAGSFEAACTALVFGVAGTTWYMFFHSTLKL